MKLPLLKRSIDIRGHRTSVSLEDAFWSELKEIAHSQRVPVRKLIAQIDDTRQQANLSSAIRLHVLEHIRSRGQGKEKTKSSSIAPSLPCDTKVASAI
jgi:predicted DNA-binding ribbon-helix-helix protein